ncbi:MAG: NlpC/P60 family protein [Chitinivibrionales bacterium]|nr:NlpC/P60 family protein [Chitinivibrionales bacterium]
MIFSMDATRFCLLRSFFLPIVFTLAPLIAGCASSVRYTRPEPRQGSEQGHYFIVHGRADDQDYSVSTARLEQIVNSYIGTRYHYGGMSRRGIDCSGFVCRVFSELNHASLPHSSEKLFKLGKSIALAEARPGDLVFFRGRFFGGISHVGICLGNNRFAHATIGAGVIISNLDEEEYAKHFAGVRRVF